MIRLSILWAIMIMSFSLTLPVLPVQFMNEDHAHARELLLRMIAQANSGDPDLSQTCRAFVEHNREHFGREEAAMQATGFPAFQVHKSEHTQALGWLADLAEQAGNGPPGQALCTAISRELPAWYLRHIETMDTVTANWINAHGTD